MTTWEIFWFLVITLFLTSPLYLHINRCRQHFASYLAIKVYILGWYSCCISFWISFKMKYNFLSFLLPQGGSEVWNVWFQDGVFVFPLGVWPEIDIKALISMHKCQCTNNCPVSKTQCLLKLFYYNVQLWLILCYRLAIYYLNAVSKGYQQANMDLKRKMQMVSRRAGLLVLFLYVFYFFKLFFKCQSS